MFIESGSENHDVVHVDNNLSSIDEVAEEVVHYGLESGEGVGKAEEHHERFEKPSVHLECHLPFIAILHLDVVIAPSDIKLGKVCSCLEFID